MPIPGMATTLLPGLGDEVTLFLAACAFACIALVYYIMARCV